MNNFYPKQIAYTLSVLAFFILASCANIPLKTIPPPSPTAKLRVYVQPITGPYPYPTGTWTMTHEDFVEKQMRGMESFLKKTGIYEVVPANEVEEVLGGQEPKYWEMERKGWKLAREIGKTLYAEYILIFERSLEKNKISGADLFFTIIMINTDTGKRFEARAIMSPSDAESYERRLAVVRDLYRNIFQGSKQDMLETAIRKSEKIYMPGKEIALVAKPGPKITKPQQDIKPEIQPIAPVKPIASVSIPELKTNIPTPEIKKQVPEQEKIPDTAQEKPEQDSGKMDRLVIYDFEAPEKYKTVALILTEVLREEIFRLNRFTLLTREALQQILDEMTLQQTGLIDEKEAVKAGKGLAANQVVTGKLGMLGKTYILQAKRIDVETFATIGFASTRFIQGQEEEVLSRLSDLAKSLAGLKQ